VVVSSRLDPRAVVRGMRPAVLPLNPRQPRHLLSALHRGHAAGNRSNGGCTGGVVVAWRG
jgi:hypothetical protein